MKSPIIAFLFIILFSLPIFAQQLQNESELTQDVNIVREYIPVIKEAGKINTQPQLSEVESKEKSAVAYTTWVTSMPAPFDLQTLPSATLNEMIPYSEQREGYVKLGGGNYTSFLGDLFVPILQTETSRLNLSANHLSTFGKVKLGNSEKAKAQNMMNGAQLNFDHNFAKTRLYSTIGFKRHDFNYYGFGYDTNNNDAHNMFHLRLGIGNRPKGGGDWNYTATILYDLTHTASGILENNVRLMGLITTYNQADEWGVHVSADNLFYNSPTSSEYNLYFTNITNQFDDYSVIKLAPFYHFQRDGWDVKAGIETFFSINKGKSFRVTPDVHANLTIIDNNLYLYGIIDGNLQTNSYRRLFDENQYMRPDVHPENTYTPLNITLGAKAKATDDLALNVFLGYRLINNQYFFVNHRDFSQIMLDNTFDVVIDKASLFSAGLSAFYTWNQHLDILLKGIYNSWLLDEQAYAWHKPNWELHLKANYKVTNDLHLSMQAFAFGEQKALGSRNSTVTLDPVFDLSLSGTYDFNSWLAVFLDLNNLFSQNYQRWYGYNVQGFNVMGGAVISF